MALEHHPPVPPHHEHMGRPHGEGHYTRDSDLIARIFPRGLDESKEHYARGIASRYGYSNLCDESKGEIAEVDIDRIFPCQSILNKTKVIELILYLRDNDVPGYPMGIKIDDDVYLLDGHHRVSAQILMGRKKVMIHYTALTQEMIDAQTPPRNERHSIRPNNETEIRETMEEADLHDRGAIRGRLPILRDLGGQGQGLEANGHARVHQEP